LNFGGNALNRLRGQLKHCLYIRVLPIRTSARKMLAVFSKPCAYQIVVDIVMLSLLLSC